MRNKILVEPSTRFVWVDIVTDRKAVTISHCLRKFISQCHFTVHTILTDNGPEYCYASAYLNDIAHDRFEDKKDSPTGQQSGNNPFDVVCQESQIKHRLTRPYRPQTNGMVERFNRRLNEAFKKVPIDNPNNSRTNHFKTHKERNDFILNLVNNYNNTRLCCLN